LPAGLIPEVAVKASCGGYHRLGNAIPGFAGVTLHVF